jgi:hypothetical protein
MKKIFCLLLIILFRGNLFSQPIPVNSQQFFLDDSIINVTITTDIKQLRTKKNKPVWQPANIVMRFFDSSVISEQIRIEPRGVDRKAHCDIAALMFNFKNKTSPLLSPLDKLKLVGSCNTGNTNEEYLLKEFLVYKIYNLLSVMSFRVRLLHVTYIDSKQKIKSFTQYAFLIESMKDMAARNNCIEIKNKPFANDALNKYQVTFMTIFQYMIGNTDWAIGNYHNIKLMVPKNDTLAKPYPVPYDFDFCGLVNAPYAIPDEKADIQNVTQRFYMGFPRTMEELEMILNAFKEKKESIILEIKNFNLLSDKTEKKVLGYLEEFYQVTDNKNSIRAAFINKAL